MGRRLASPRFRRRLAWTVVLAGIPATLVVAAIVIGNTGKSPATPLTHDRVYGAAEIPKSLRIQAVWIWGQGGDVFTDDYSATRINEPSALNAWGFLTDHIVKAAQAVAAHHLDAPGGLTATACHLKAPSCTWTGRRYGWWRSWTCPIPAGGPMTCR